MTLTPEGERLYHRVAIAFEQLELGEDEVRQDCGLEAGTISVAASETALHLLLLDKLSAFHAKYPGVRLRITNDSTPQAVASLRSGQVDCAVVTSPHQVEKPLKCTPLLSFREILVCGTQYKDLAARMRSLKDLEGYPLVCLSRNTGTYDFYQRLFIKHDLPFHVDMEAATMDQVLPMIRHNLGIGFYSERLVAHSLAAGEVYQVRLVEPIPERAVCLIEDSSRPASVAVKAFRQLLCQG